MTPESDQQFETITILELKNEISITKKELNHVLEQFETIDSEAKIEIEQSKAENEISMLKVQRTLHLYI